MPRACGHMIDGKPVTVQHAKDTECPLHAANRRVRALEAREAEWITWAERAIPELSEHASITPMRDGGGVGDVLCMEAFQRLIDAARRGEG